MEHDNISEIRYEIAEAQQLTSSSFRYRGIELCLILYSCTVCGLELSDTVQILETAIITWIQLYLACVYHVCVRVCVCMPGFVLTNNVQFLPVKISVYWQSDRLVLKTKNATQRESVVCGVVWCGVCVCVWVCVCVLGGMSVCMCVTCMFVCMC